MPILLFAAVLYIISDRVLSYYLRRILIPILLVPLAGCNHQPEWYPPPEQRQPPVLPEPPPGSTAVKMNDTDAPEHFVKDISAKLEGDTWRWTQKRPTLKILLTKTRDLKFVADFTLWEGTMQQTGPVTISFFVDEKVLDKVRYDTPGYKHFEKPVDPAWLQTATDTIVSAEIDKLYVDPGDKATLGFILTRMGFERQ